LEKARVISQIVEYEDAGHGFQGEDARKAAEAMVEWFQRHLAAGIAK
jgi:dipeptidyl aminopeptidase/acylaminoacyl peptidase